MNKPDSVLVEMALKGDRIAFRQIVEDTQPMVYKVAYRFLNNPHEAEDAVQEVYIRLWKNLSGYKPGVKISTWLYRIVTNYCLDVLKSRQYRMASKSGNIAEHSVKGDLRADRELSGKEAADILMIATEKLTPVQKAVFILRDLEGLSPGEVKSLLDISTDRIKSNLYHARKRMSELLSPFKNELL